MFSQSEDEEQHTHIQEQGTNDLLEDAQSNSSGLPIFSTTGRGLYDLRSPLEKMRQLLQKSRTKEEYKESPLPNNSFFSSNVKKERQKFLKMLNLGLLIAGLAVLCVLSLYWGSLYELGQHIHNLEGIVVDFDQQSIGVAVKQAFREFTGLPHQLTWTIASSREFKNVEQVIQAVLNEEYWIAVVVGPGSTNTLQEAIRTRNPAYNSTSTITIYGSEARSENAYSEFIIPRVEEAIRSAQRTFTSRHVASLSSLGGLSDLLNGAPETVYRPIDFQISNLRPFDVPVATAANFVGLIYLLVIAFILAVLSFGAQRESGMYRKISLMSFIKLRLVLAIAIYFIFSLLYSFISLFFQVPFGRFYGGKGFIIYWMSSFLGMCALGLALEAMLTILTPRFTPFFLILWMIVNVSIATVPIEILPAFYRYGYATPFYNISRTVRAVIFNTKNEIIYNFLVLLAWCLISIFTITCFQIYQNRKELGPGVFERLFKKKSSRSSHSN